MRKRIPEVQMHIEQNWQSSYLSVEKVTAYWKRHKQRWYKHLQEWWVYMLPLLSPRTIQGQPHLPQMCLWSIHQSQQRHGIHIACCSRISQPDLTSWQCNRTHHSIHYSCMCHRFRSIAPYVQWPLQIQHNKEMSSASSHWARRR